MTELPPDAGTTPDQLAFDVDHPDPHHRLARCLAGDPVEMAEEDCVGHSHQSDQGQDEEVVPEHRPEYDEGNEVDQVTDGPSAPVGQRYR